MSYIPYITVTGKRGEMSTKDTVSVMFESGIIFLSGEIDFRMAVSISSQLLTLSKTLPLNHMIRIIINSPGGSVAAGMCIIDAMHSMKHIVSTEIMGMAYSAASFIFASGTKGYRRMTPRSYLMIHQVMGGTSGTAMQMIDYIEQVKREQRDIIKILEAFTNLSEAEIIEMMKGDFYIDAQSAIKYGFADSILSYETMHNPALDHVNSFNRAALQVA